MKRFISGVIIGAVFSSTIALAASYLTESATFKVMVNGNEFNSDPPALVVEGRTYLPLRAIGDVLGVPVEWNASLNQVEVGTTASVPTKEPYETIEVSTSKEFLENIKSNATIILNKGIYNLSEVDEVSNKFVTKSEVFDGYEYIINSVKGLKIKSADNAEVTIVVEPRYADVLKFSNCSDIVIEGVIAGHTVEKGYCMGGVIMFDNMSNADISECKLYGCGTYGIIGCESENINVSDTEIYDCTYGATEMRNCENVTFDSCMFRDCEKFSIFDFSECNRIHITNSTIKNNRTDSEYFAFISSSKSKDIIFSNCTFEKNKYQTFTDTEDIVFNNCTIG